MTSIVYEKDGAVGMLLSAKPPHNLMDNVKTYETGSISAVAICGSCLALLLRSSVRHSYTRVDVGVIVGGIRLQDVLKNLWERLEKVPIATVTASLSQTDGSRDLRPLLGGVQGLAGLAPAGEMTMLGRNRIRARVSTGRSSARLDRRRNLGSFTGVSISPPRFPTPQIQSS